LEARVINIPPWHCQTEYPFALINRDKFLAFINIFVPNGLMVCEYNLLTDIHIATQIHEIGKNYGAGIVRFRQCLRAAGSKAPTLILGDIPHTRCAGNYRDSADILRNQAKVREVIGGKKVYAIPGNHDSEDFIAEVNGQADGFVPYAIEGKGHRILMLNSSPTIEGIRYNHGGLDDYHQGTIKNCGAEK